MGYPELIYLYVEDFGYCFQKQEFVFSLNYDVQYTNTKDRTLTITPKDNPFEEMYGADITNISLLVGSNGSGKTSVMELLTRPEAFAKNLQKKYPGKAASMGWFAIYAVDFQGVGEARKTTYYLEGWNNELISNFTEKLSQPQEMYSCYFSMQEDKIVCFSRDNISDKLQLYYCPVNCRSFSVGERTDKGLLKYAIERADSLNFFRFISTNGKQINDSVHADNVEFSVKMDNTVYSIEESDVTEFTTVKSRFLLNLHCNFTTELKQTLENDQTLENELFMDLDSYRGLPEEVLMLYYGELNEECYDNVSGLCRYDKKINCDSKADLPVWFYHEQSHEKKNLVKDIKKYAKMLTAISRVDDRYFVSELQVDIPAIKLSSFPDMEYIFEYFEEYRKEGEYCEDSLELPSVRCEYHNISEGEEAFLRFFSSVMQCIEKMPGKRNCNTYGTRILLLDEPDLSMHPEWSRTFLKDLTKLLSGRRGEGRTRYQIIVSTHSPFMISDVLKENVLCFERERESGAIQVHPSRYGLLSNIHDIMADTFFLDSPFGELGNDIFDKKIIGMINEITSVDDPQIPTILAYISAIGDHFIWSQVNSLLQNRLQELSETRESSRQKRIQILEEEIKVLKEENLK